jgi:hypothetical protein
MRVDVEQIRNNSRVLIQESQALAKKAQQSIERARNLSHEAKLIRQDMIARLGRKPGRT